MPTPLHQIFYDSKHLKHSVPGDESGFERQRTDGDAEPIHARRLPGIAFRPDLELVHQVCEEDEELHLGQVFAEASPLADSERDHAWMRNEVSVLIQEPFRLEPLRFRENSRVHVDVGQVRDDAGAGGDGELADGRRRSDGVHQSKRCHVAEPLDLQEHSFRVGQLLPELSHGSSVIFGQHSIQLFLQWLCNNLLTFRAGTLFEMFFKRPKNELL